MPAWKITFRINIELDNKEIVSTLAKCHALAKVINNIPITPRRQQKLDRLNILRAVRGTTGIEGANLSEDEVRQIIEAPKSKPVLPANRQREEKEARNADILMKYVARLVNNDPDCALDEDLVRTFHKILTKDIEYEQNVSGEYRTVAVRVGDYSPPQPAEVKGLMEGFISWFNEGEPVEWDPIIRAITAHFYVVGIHPFCDGNGRTARGVESFLLYKAGINARGFYSLANYYYQNRSAYINYLNEVRFETRDDLTPFVLFALRGLVSELEFVHQEVLQEVKEIAFRDLIRDTLQDKTDSKPGKRMLEFVMELGLEQVNIKDIRSGKHKLSKLYRDLNPKTLSRDLDELEKRQLIKIQGGLVRANLDLMDRYMARNHI